MKLTCLTSPRQIPSLKTLEYIPMDGIEEVDELDEYLSLPIERVRDPLAWWWEHRHTYPRLSAMAFDFLSAPGMYHLLIYFTIDAHI